MPVNTEAIGKRYPASVYAVGREKIREYAYAVEWGGVVVAGDEITTTTTVAEIGERAGMGSYVFRTDSQNERGDTVCTGIWRQLVRGS